SWRAATCGRSMPYSPRSRTRPMPMHDPALRSHNIRSDVIFTGRLQVGDIQYGPLHIDGDDRFTASTSEGTLETITIPAGAMGTKGAVHLVVHGRAQGTMGMKAFVIRFGGTNIGT